MAENEFEKTVKLPASGPQSVPPPDKTPQMPGDMDKTVKLTPAVDKTVKLTVPPPALSASPATPAAPAPVPQQKPVPPAPMAPPPPEFVSERKSNLLKVFVIVIAVLVVAAGAGWFFLPPWLKARADNFSKQGNHTKAVQQLQWALYIFPRNSESLMLNMGQEMRLSRDFQNAQKVLERVLGKNPNQYKAQKELGLTLKDVGQNQKALDLFQKCVQSNPADADVLKWSAQLAFELKDYSIASSAYDKIAKSGKAEGEDLYRLGLSYFELQKPEESLAALKSAGEKSKDLKGIHGLIAKIYASQERYVEAIEEHKSEMALSPNDAAVTGAFVDCCAAGGNFYMAKNKFNDAQQCFQEGLTAPSDRSAHLHYQLAITFTKMKKKKDAFKHLKEAVKADAALKLKAKSDRVLAPYSKLPEFKKILK